MRGCSMRNITDEEVEDVEKFTAKFEIQRFECAPGATRKLLGAPALLAPCIAMKISHFFLFSCFFALK